MKNTKKVIEIPKIISEVNDEKEMDPNKAKVQLKQIMNSKNRMRVKLAKTSNEYSRINFIKTCNRWYADIDDIIIILREAQARSYSVDEKNQISSPETLENLILTFSEARRKYDSEERKEGEVEEVYLSNKKLTSII